MKTVLNGIQKTWEWINKLNRTFGFLLLLGIIFCIGGQILSRWLADTVWPWAEEVAEVLLIGTIVLYNGYAEQTDEHVRLEALFSAFPKMKAPMLQIGRILTMVMCAFIIYTEIIFLPSVVHGTTKVVHIPLTWIHAMILVGFVFYFIDLSVNCYKHWKHIPFGLTDNSAEEDSIFDVPTKMGRGDTD